MSEFIYDLPFQTEKDPTNYRLLTDKYVSIVETDGRRILKIDPEGMVLLAKTAVSDLSFYLRTSHLEKLKKILDDPEATDNDRFVAYMMLRNSVISAGEDLPWCQDTGTAIVIGKKGEAIKKIGEKARQDIEEFIGKGIYLELYVKVKEKLDTVYCLTVYIKLK